MIHDITLTQEIKEYILENRIYHIKKENPHRTIQNIITYNNTMHNYISSMDPIEKLHKFLKHNQTHLIDFSNHVEGKLQYRIEELQQGDDVQLTKDDILDLVDSISKTASKNMKEFNILYDGKAKKLKMYDEGEWTDYITPKGVKLVIKAIQEFYLERYECHLIRKMESKQVSIRERQHCGELLDDYYKFIAVFDVQPIVSNKRDRDILYDMSDERFFKASSSTNLSEKYMSMYKRIKDVLPQKEVDKVRKHVVDILKQNTRHNIEKLNKHVASLFNIDESFKELILKKGVEHTSDEVWNLESSDSDHE